MAEKKFFTLQNGRPTPDTTADLAFLPTSDEKAALVGPAGFTPSASDPYATKSYADTYNEWYKSVDYSVEYVKADAGAPSGTGASGELCLNTNEVKLYTYTTSWDAGVAVTSGQRFIHKDSGVDTSGDSGTYTKSDKIFDYNGTSFIETTPTKGSSVIVDEEGTGGEEYKYDGSDWVAKASVTAHNALTGKQGGTTDEYYHLTSDQNAGIAAATTIVTGNPPQTLLDRDKMPVKYTFRYDGGVPVSQTDLAIYDDLGTFTEVQMPSAGSIVKSSIQSSSARTAGTLDMKPAVNGTAITATALNLQLNDTETTKDSAETAPATTNATFSAGDTMGPQLTSSADWAHGSGNIRVDIYVVFDS